MGVYILLRCSHLILCVFLNCGTRSLRVGLASPVSSYSWRHAFGCCCAAALQEAAATLLLVK